MMKKVLFTLTLLVATLTIGFTQVVTYSDPIPKYGCPNTTHDVTLGIINSYPITIPANSYTITITIFNDMAVQFHNVVMTNTPEIPSSTAGGQVDIIIEDVTFQAEMTCSLSIKIDYTYPTSGSYTTPASYDVQYPPTLTITENPTGTLDVTNTLEGVDSVRYYLNANYASFEDESTSGTFTPSVSGSYTAKAYEPNTGCISVAASNAVTITATTGILDTKIVNVSVYPNPMASSITITTPLSNKLHYQLADMNGMVVRSADFTSTTNVNVESLKTGSYILTVRDNHQKIASYKLVK
jgi:hypothetical protein